MLVGVYVLFVFFVRVFLIPITSNLSDSLKTPNQKYIIRLVLGRNGKINSDIEPTP